MNSLEERLLALEGRITILERELKNSERQNNNRAKLETELFENREYESDNPDILLRPAFAPEYDENGRSFRWLASNPEIQIRMPRIAQASYGCVLVLRPHHRVTWPRLVVRDTSTNTVLSSGVSEAGDALSFIIPSGASPFVTLSIEGFSAVRPAEIGEGEDNRLLSVRYYGAVVSPLTKATGHE